MLRKFSCRYSWNKCQQHTFQVSVKEFCNHINQLWHRFSQGSVTLNFLIFQLIILTELPLSSRNSTGRALFNVNVVFVNGLLIVKLYSSSEELSFRDKLTGKYWGFDLQTVARCPTSHIFEKFFLLLYCTYWQDGLNSHNKNSTYWKENHTYLLLLSALPYQPAFHLAV